MARTFFNKRNIPVSGRSGKPQVSFKLFGQWDEAIRIISRLSPAIKEASLKAQMKICREIAKRVKGHIKNQDLNWQPLSSEYASRKAAAGLSGNILEAYGNYYNAIQAWQVSNQHFAFVGVKKGMYTRNISGRRSKYDIASIAAIHELSQGRIIPKRPLWNPTIAEMGGSMGLKNAYTEHLINNLRMKGIPISDVRKIIFKR